MNIAEELKKFLEQSGWSAYKLAKEAKVHQCSITRLINGQRKSIRTDTLEKLWPYLFGDKSPLQASYQNNNTKRGQNG